MTSEVSLQLHQDVHRAGQDFKPGVKMFFVLLHNTPLIFLSDTSESTSDLFLRRQQYATYSPTRTTKVSETSITSPKA